MELSHGSELLRNFGLQPGGVPAHVFRMSQAPRASYEVVVDSASGDVGPGLILRRMAADGTTVLQDAQPVSPLDFARSLRWVNETTAQVDDQLIRVQSASCTTDCGADDVYRIRAYETTYNAPRFNNSGSQITVVLLQNPGTSTVSGSIFFWRADSVLLDTEPFSLGAHQTLVLITNSLPSLTGTSGSITVVHDGPYGSLAGKTVALEPSTGFSFDTPLVPRLR